MVTLTAFKAENFGVLPPLRALKQDWQNRYAPSMMLQLSNRTTFSEDFIELKRGSSIRISFDPAFAINSPHDAHDVSTPAQAS